MTERPIQLTTFLMLLAMLFTQQAHGHTALQDSSPAADSTLEETPDEIVLKFNQSVTPVNVTLTGPDDGLVESVGEAVANEEGVAVPIVAPLESGLYVVSFRVLSGDGHPIDGRFEFSIAASPSAVATVDPAERPGESLSARVEEAVSSTTGTSVVETADKLARVAYMLMLLLAIGLVVFRITIRLSTALDSWVVLLTRSAAISGVLLSVVYFATTTLAVTGTGGVRSDHLYLIAQSSIGTSLLLAAIGFFVLAVGTGASRTIAGAAVALLIISRVVTGHPASQAPMLVLVPGMALHIVTAAFWFASLWVLLRALRTEPSSGLAALVSDFSRAALWFVSALLGAGVIMASVHLDSVDALFNSTYGQTLMWKLGGVAGLLLLAGVNRFVLTPGLVKQSRSDGLSASIRFESLLMVAVIAISTVLAATLPSL